MKVLLVNKFLYPRGGAETYIFRIGEELKRRGHSVQYFGMYDPKNIVGNDLNLSTKEMNFRGKGLDTITYPFRIVYSVEAERKIGKVIDAFKPDVVHLNNIHFHLTPSIISACRKKGVPVVWTVHDYQLLCPNHLFYNGHICTDCLDGHFGHCIKGRCIHESLAKSVMGTIEACFYKNLDLYNYVSRFICPSKFMEKMIKENLTQDKAVLIQNFLEQIPLIDGQKEDYVLYFGRISEEKGIDQIVAAAKALPEIRFKVAGSGPEEDKVKGISNIDFVGFKTGVELHTLIAHAAFSLYPSVWYENCPLSIMESLSLKTPVITRDLGGMAELVEDGVTGYRVRNEEEFIDRIRRLHSDKTLQEEMQGNCEGAAFMNLSEYVDGLLSIYDVASSAHSERI